MEISYQSPVLDAGERSPFSSNFQLRLPRRAFGPTDRYLQLVSYSNTAGAGYARSTPLELPFRTSLNLSLNTSTMPTTRTRREACDFRERPRSEAMFIGKLLGFMPEIMKVAVPIVNKLFAGGKKEGEATGPLIDEQTTNAILDLIKKLAGGDGAQAKAKSLGLGSEPTISPGTLMALGPVLGQSLTPSSIGVVGERPEQLLLAVSEAAGLMAPNGYSRAKVAPALLAALPALAPLLEKLFDPKMIQAIGDQPVKVFKAVSDAVLKMDQQNITHLENINPGVDDPSIAGLMAGMSLNISDGVEVPYRFSSALSLHCPGVITVMVGGAKRVVYAQGLDMLIPFAVKPEGKTPPHLNKAIVQLVIRQGASRKILLERSFRFYNLAIREAVVNELRIPANIADKLPQGEDLKVGIHLRWQSKGGETFGTFKHHFVRRSGSYCFGELGKMIGPETPLNDLEVHRAFWHRAWEGGFSESRRWKIDFDFKYYYTLASRQPQSAKTETRYRVRTDNATPDNPRPNRRKLEAQLKSGFRAGSGALNDLLPQLGHPRLMPEQLAAVSGREVEENFSQAIRQSLTFSAGAGDTVGLWVYPEVRAQEIILIRLAEPDDYGQFAAAIPEQHVFAKPTSLHLIGTKSN